MDNQLANDVLTLSGIVAAYVGVFRGLNLIDTKFLPLLAVLIASVFVLIPDVAQQKLIIISVIGLSATGVYHLSKSPSTPSTPDSTIAKEVVDKPKP